jgi:Cu-Zn family superoxide dismutase
MVTRHTRRSATGLVCLLLAFVGLLGATAGSLAQDATPPATPKSYADVGAVNVILMNAAGDDVGSAIFTPDADGKIHIVVQVQDTTLAEGSHGIHVHQAGVCDASGSEPFSSAGEHLNPNASHHGAPELATPGTMANAEDAHAGDLGNIMIAADGTGHLETDNNLFVLTSGQPNSLLDADGSAIIIHQGTDDLKTDPSGDSGPRAICGIIFAPGQENSTPVVDSGSPPPATAQP